MFLHIWVSKGHMPHFSVFSKKHQWAGFLLSFTGESKKISLSLCVSYFFMNSVSNMKLQKSQLHNILIGISVVPGTTSLMLLDAHHITHPGTTLLSEISFLPADQKR